MGISKGTKVAEQTTAQTQYLDMIACLLGRQSYQCGRKEHCLVIRMSYEKADALVVETWEGSASHLRCV